MFVLPCSKLSGIHLLRKVLILVLKPAQIDAKSRLVPVHFHKCWTISQTLTLDSAPNFGAAIAFIFCCFHWFFQALIYTHYHPNETLVVHFICSWICHFWFFWMIGSNGHSLLPAEIVSFLVPLILLYLDFLLLHANDAFFQTFYRGQKLLFANYLMATHFWPKANCFRCNLFLSLANILSIGLVYAPYFRCKVICQCCVYCLWIVFPHLDPAQEGTALTQTGLRRPTLTPVTLVCRLILLWIYYGSV